MRWALTGTVWDAVIAETVEHVCTTHGADVPASTEARGPPALVVLTRTDRARSTLANVPAAFIWHNASIEPRNPDGARRRASWRSTPPSMNFGPAS